MKKNLASNQEEKGIIISCCSVAKSCPTLCDPMNRSTPGFPLLRYLSVCPRSRPLHQWCHPTISPSVAPFSSCPQSFPASGSLLVSQLLASVGQGVRASASASAHKHLLSAYYVQHIKKQRHYFVNKGPSSQGYGFSSSCVWI